MPDKSSYSGSWYEGKQHGYGCTWNSRQEVKYGLWRRGEKLIKLTPAQATDIQDGLINLKETSQFQALGDEKLAFFAEITILTNFFEPFANFTTEQAKFELNKCTQMERADNLKDQL